MRLCDGGGHTVYWVFARLRLGFDRLQAGMASNILSMLITCKKGTAHAVPFLLALGSSSPLQGETVESAPRFTPFPPYYCESLPLSGLPNISRCENHNPALVALWLVRAQLSSDL